MPASVHALDWLSAKASSADVRVAVLFGDDAFLQRMCYERLREAVLEAGDAEYSATSFDGRTALWRDVLDELSTVALFGGGKRLALVEQADELVTKNRQALEDYVAKPRSTGVLVLEVGTWPSNTRLAKAVAEHHLAVECKAPPAAKLAKWLVAWAKSEHGATLKSDAAETLVEIVGPEVGLLHQELAKLSAYAGSGGTIDEATVSSLVGGWRAETAWVMLDAALEGNAPAALAQLDRLLLAGENEIALLAQIGSTLRKFAMAAARIAEFQHGRQRIDLRQALEAAGIKGFVLAKSEIQLRQLGRERAEQLSAWLVDADLGLKGASALSPRAVLETLIVRMSRTMDPRAGGVAQAIAAGR